LRRRLTEHQTRGTKKKKRNTIRYIIIKALNIQKKEFLKLQRRRLVTYKGKSIRIKAGISTQIQNARRPQKDILQALKENNCHSQLDYTAKLSFLNEGEMKIFHKKLTLKEFMTTKPALQKIFIGLLHT
jgi:hypothetical protein